MSNKFALIDVYFITDISSKLSKYKTTFISLEEIRSNLLYTAKGQLNPAYIVSMTSANIKVPMYDIQTDKVYEYEYEYTIVNMSNNDTYRVDETIYKLSNKIHGIMKR